MVPQTELSIPVSNILAIGDNIKGDMWAAHEARIGRKIWVDKKNGWRHYRQGILPPETTIVSRMDSLLQLGWREEWYKLAESLDEPLNT